MNHVGEAARYVVLDQIMSHVHDACPFAGDSQQREWDETIAGTMIGMPLNSLKEILQEWQEDSDAQGVSLVHH